MKVTEEQLAAFADGELEGAEHDRVAAAVAGDPELAKKVAAHRKLRDRLGAHFAPLLEQEVPDTLRAAITDARKAGSDEQVVDLIAARRERDGKRARSVRWQWIAAPALAATLALALFLPRGNGGADYAGGALAQALDNQLVATQQAGAATRILLSFKQADGEFCRVFTSPAQSGIACHDAHGWKLVRSIAGGGEADTQYRQAGSPAAKLLSDAQQMAAGPALDNAEEQAARRAGWQ